MSSLNWAERSQGRKFARRLFSPGVDDANIDGRHPTTAYAGHPASNVGLWDGGNNRAFYQQPTIDDGSLRFDVIAGKRIPDWFGDLGHRYGANSVMHVQFQAWYSPSFIDTVFKTTSAGYPGVKIAVISDFANSSAWNKLVLSTRDQRKFPYLYQYDQWGNTFNMQVAIGAAVDFDLQPKVGIAPACLYTSLKTAGPGQCPDGCIGLPAEKWIVWDLIVETGDLIPNTNTWHCDRKLYMTVDGVKQLVMHYNRDLWGYRGRNAKAFEAIWLTPYMTDKDWAQLHPDAVVRYREVIVDTEPIPEVQFLQENDMIQDVIDSAKHTLDLSYAEAGQPSLVTQLDAQATQIATLQSDLDAANAAKAAAEDKVVQLKAGIQTMKNKDAVADAAETADYDALLNL